MSNKTLLVAGREYMENLRTKTFWIGILFFPIMLMLSVAVPRWLKSTKAARQYVVIDQSGFLLEAVDRRAELPDLEKIFSMALERREQGGRDWERLPPVLKQIADDIAGAADSPQLRQLEQLPPELKGDPDEQPTQAAARLFARSIAMLSSPEGAQVRAYVPKAALDKLDALSAELRAWWKALPPNEARAFDNDLSKARYLRVAAPEGADSLGELNRLVGDNQLFAYFVIGPDPVHADEGCKYVSNNLTDNDLRRWFTDLVTEEIRERRLAEKQIETAIAQWIQRPVKFEEKEVGKGGEEKHVSEVRKVEQFAPVVFVYLLWMAVFTISQMLLTNTIEEKSNRILEVLLSSVTPLQLMLGKIFGIAATGLTVTLSWVGFFLLAVELMPLIGFEIPVDLTPIVTNPVYLMSFVGYFLIGYLFFAALFVGIGSVCNSLKEAQNLVMPVTFVLMVPLLAMMPIVQDPDGGLAKGLSWIPPFTPFVMMNRAGGNITQFEYVGTSVLMVVSVIATMWAAAKVFRIGVLMTGKAPTPWEIFHWVRTPVGHVPLRKDGDAR